MRYVKRHRVHFLLFVLLLLLLAFRERKTTTVYV
jgi:hypothetical protein